MRRLFAILVLGAIAGLTAGIAALLYTEAGLQWSFARVQRLLPGQLAVERIEGRLAGPLTLSGLRYEDASLIVRADRLTLRWQPGRLVDGLLLVDALELRAVDLTLKPAPTRHGGAGLDLKLPLAIELRRFDAAQLHITRPGQAPVAIETLGFSAVARDRAVSLTGLHAAAPSFALDAEGEVPLNLRDELRLSLHGETRVREHAVAGTATLGGTWRRLAADLRLARPLALAMNAEIDTGIGRAGDAAPHWQLRATAEPFEPATLLPQVPPGRAAGLALQAEGRGADFTADGGLTWHDGRYGDWALTLSAVRAGTLWELPQFRLRSLPGGVTIDGRARARLDAGTVRDYLVEARWRDLTWPPQTRGPPLSPQGTLRLAGSDLARYDFTLTGTLQPPRVPPLTLTASGQGDHAGIRVETLAGDWLDGDWTGSGTLAWSPALRWDAALAARQANPAALRADFDGRLDAEAQVRGGFTGGALDLDIEVARLAGMLRGHPLSARTRVALQAGELRIEDLQLRSGDATLAGNAHFGAEWRLDWRLRAPVLAELIPDAAGALATAGSLIGPPDALRARFELTGQDLAWRELRAGDLRAHADLDLAPAGRWELHARAEDAGGRALRGRLALDGSGTSLDHTVRLSFESGERRLAQAASGVWRDRRWQGRLHDGRLELAVLGTLSQQDSAELEVAADNVRLQGWCWRQDATRVCLAGAGRPATRDLTGSAVWNAFELARLSPLVAPVGVALEGAAAGEAHVALAAGALQALDLNLRLGAGTLSYPVPAAEQRDNLHYRQASLALRGDDERGLSADLRVDLDAGARLAVAARLPEWRPAAAEDYAQQALTGNIDLELNELGLLSLLVPDLLPGDGYLQARLALGGTVTDPRLDGEIEATLATLAIVRLGLNLQDVRLQAQLRQNRWRLQGALRSGAGRLALDGSGFLRGAREWEASLALSGERVEIVRLPAARVVASPDLTLRATPGDFAFAGTLGIPAAQLEPVTAEGATGVSDDVVIVGGESREAVPRLRVHGNLELVLGDEVRIAGRGLEGRLTGRLRVLMGGMDDVAGQGEVRFVEGRYRAYGQNLAIDQGRVLYAGGPIDNPALDIVASRQRGEDIKVGVRVTGTARQPLVQLFSEPAMDDGDVLAYIILGRPLAQASATEGQALYQAATSIALVGGEAVAGRIAGVFNISEVSIEAGATATDTALVLGKSLSPRLYVRYIQGLVDNTSAFQIRYRLSDRWTLETESGTRSGSGADIIYTLER